MSNRRRGLQERSGLWVRRVNALNTHGRNRDPHQPAASPKPSVHTHLQDSRPLLRLCRHSLLRPPGRPARVQLLLQPLVDLLKAHAAALGV